MRCLAFHHHAPSLSCKSKANAHPSLAAIEVALSQLCACLLAKDMGNAKRILIDLPGNFFKVTVLAASVSCVLNISEFCIMGNVKKSTFSPFRLPNSMDEFKNTFFSEKEIVIAG